MSHFLLNFFVLLVNNFVDAFGPRLTPVVLPSFDFSDIKIATACFGFVTFGPVGDPLFSVPCLNSDITFELGIILLTMQRRGTRCQRANCSTPTPRPKSIASFVSSGSCLLPP